MDRYIICSGCYPSDCCKFNPSFRWQLYSHYGKSRPDNDGFSSTKSIFRNDSLLLDAPVIAGQYKAVVTSKTSMDGFWNQHGLTLPLKLTKSEALKSQ